jgi:hypothetical protein
MINLIKNPKFASGVLVVALVCSLFGGNVKSLNKLANEVEKSFYDSGKEDATDTIAAQLVKRADAAMGLITVANNYGVDTSELSAVRANLIDAESARQQAVYNDALGIAFEDVAAATGKAALTERDRNTVTDYINKFNGSGSMIAKLAVEYNARIDKFPRNLFGIKPDKI